MIGWVPTHTGDCVEKESAVASLGQSTLLLPAWIKAALQANDRLKLYLSVLQSAAQRAANPAATSPDWTREIAHLGLRDATWLKDVATTAYLQDQTLIVPELSLWLEALASDLSIMARPLCDIAEHKDEEGLNPQMLNDLTHGNRHGSDSFHLLVMDLHKQLNAMAVAVATEDVDGAHVWQVEDGDRPLIRAFMRGLARTAALKFSHPGPDTALTRDGKRLLIHNDIGTNDAHVLVIEVQERTIHLTYSDLHVARFGFFQQMLEAIGFNWTVFDPRTSDGLNQGKPYQVGNAVLTASDDVQ